MADRAIMPVALDSNGDIVAAAQAYFYERGTLTPLTVYQDEAGLTPHSSPVVASAAGVFAPVFVTDSYKLDIEDTLGASLPGYPSDPGYTSPEGATGASSVTFSPITGNPATNVQAAIQTLTTLWNAVTTYGRQLISAADAATARTTLGLGTAAVVDVIDEDSFATDSATRPPSQQSTKAYIGTRLQRAVFHDNQTSGTNGGTFTSGAWQTRTLNSTNFNDITGASLATNQITLPAGTYRITARVPGHACALHHARIQNVTDAVVYYGSSAKTDGLVQNDSVVEIGVTFAGTKVLQVEHRCSVTRATDGFGVANSFGGSEKYTMVCIDRLG